MKHCTAPSSGYEATRQKGLPVQTDPIQKENPVFINSPGNSYEIKYGSCVCYKTRPITKEANPPEASLIGVGQCTTY